MKANYLLFSLALAGAAVATLPEPVARLANMTLKPSDFLVNSSALPLVTFPLQDSYAGRLPISAGANETRQLTFWYWPSSAKGGSKKLSIWLNGGPGCSSFSGFLTENGPISFQAGAAAPSFNQYAWTSVSDMLWIEQPVGTGFTLGEPYVRNETQIADGFYGFLQQFYKVFPDLVKKELYFTGEGYAGMYIPYITSRIINASPSEKKSLPLNLQSFLVVNGHYASLMPMMDAPVYNFAKRNQKVLGLDNSTLEYLHDLSVSCKYQELMNKATYPPKGMIPLPNGNQDIYQWGCVPAIDLWAAAEDANPCFNYYRITDKCPTPSKNDVPYFSRPDVQTALHLPNFGNWTDCQPFDKHVFPGRIDRSKYSETLLPSLSSKLPKGFSLWHGVEDAFYISDGVRVVLQNLTWGGSQGLTKPPTTPLVVDGAKKGVYTTERNLTYIEFDNAGRMVPQDQPAAALHAFKWMLEGGEL